jgi:hypothetical protein
MTAIKQAVKAAGGQSEVSRKLSANKDSPGTLTPQAVGYWCRKDRIPAEWVIPLEKLQTVVKRGEIRPDLYPAND